LWRYDKKTDQELSLALLRRCVGTLSRGRTRRVQGLGRFDFVVSSVDEGWAVRVGIFGSRLCSLRCLLRASLKVFVEILEQVQLGGETPVKI
jgi:hypothetical protein